MTAGDNGIAGTLTAEEVERYHHDGYLSPVRATTLERAADLLAHYDAFKARGEAEQAEAQKEFIEARCDVEVALAELERAVGGKLPTLE